MNYFRSTPIRYCISGIILLVGLSSASLIHQRTEPQTVNASMSEGLDPSLYQLNPEDSKQYLRELELYGGQANVLAYEIRCWLVGLWHGSLLAYIVAGFSILASIWVLYDPDPCCPCDAPHSGRHVRPCTTYQGPPWQNR